MSLKLSIYKIWVSPPSRSCPR